MEAIALAELVVYIEKAPRPTVFQLSDLAKMYSSSPEQLGAHVPDCINSTGLKDRLLAQTPELSTFTEGKEVKLGFSRNIGAALNVAKTHDHDAEAKERKELFCKKQCVNGAFDAHSQRSEVPELLLALVDMILERPNVKNK